MIHLWAPPFLSFLGPQWGARSRVDPLLKRGTLPRIAPSRSRVPVCCNVQYRVYIYRKAREMFLGASNLSPALKVFHFTMVLFKNLYKTARKGAGSMLVESSELGRCQARAPGLAGNKGLRRCCNRRSHGALGKVQFGVSGLSESAFFSRLLIFE